MSSNQSSIPPEDLNEPELNEEELDFSKTVIDLEDFKNNLMNFPSERLCEIVVSFRYLGILEQEAIIAMNELAHRRTEGEQLHYEEKIEEMLKSLPQVNMDLAKVLKSIRI